MNTAPPSGAELEAMLAEHASRYPEKCKITVRGDHGAAVSLPFLLVNPKDKSSGWADFMRTCLVRADRPSDLEDRMAAECIAWPPAKEWAIWSQRWPSLGAKVAEAILRKVGATDASVAETAPDEKPPESLASVLDTHPKAVWLKLTVGEGYTIAIEPPAPAVWRIFKKSLTATGADVTKIARDLVLKCIIAPDDGAALLDRWPGLVGHVISEVGSLTGASADVSMGEW